MRPVLGPQAKWVLLDKKCNFVGAALGQIKQWSELPPLKEIRIDV